VNRLAASLRGQPPRWDAVQRAAGGRTLNHRVASVLGRDGGPPRKDLSANGNSPKPYIRVVPPAGPMSFFVSGDFDGRFFFFGCCCEQESGRYRSSVHASNGGPFRGSRGGSRRPWTERLGVGPPLRSAVRRATTAQRSKLDEVMAS